MKPLLMCLLLAQSGASPNLIEQAESLAVKGDEKAALSLYEEAEDAGESSQGLYYNIGTLALTQGDFAKAAIYLRRAQRIENDSDVEHNLSILSKSRKNRLEENESRGLWLTLRTLVSAKVASVVFALLFLFCALLLSLAFARRQKRGLALSLSSLLMLVASVLLWAHARVESEQGAVVVSETEAFAAPEAGSKELFKAHPGLFGDVLEREKGFTKLRLQNGIDIWVKDASLTFD